MSIHDESDVPFEAEMIEEVLSVFDAKQAWLFLLPVDGNGLLQVKAAMFNEQLTIPATAENICALLYRAEMQKLTFCGVSIVDGEDLVKGIVPKTIDEPYRTYFQRRIRDYTRDILVRSGATVAMLEDCSDLTLTGENPRMMN